MTKPFAEAPTSQVDQLAIPAHEGRVSREALEGVLRVMIECQDDILGIQAEMLAPPPDDLDLQDSELEERDRQLSDDLIEKTSFREGMGEVLDTLFPIVYDVEQRLQQRWSAAAYTPDQLYIQHQLDEAAVAARQQAEADADAAESIARQSTLVTHG